MAKLNGLELKNVEKFKGHEREDLYEADIFLQNKKIGHWCQDYMNGPADIRFDSKYDEQKLVDKIIYYNKDVQDPFEVSFGNLDGDMRPWDGFKDSCLELMLPNLVFLKEWEKEFKKLQKKTENAMVIVATDGYHEYLGLFANVSKEEALESMKNDDFEFFGNKEEKYHVFTNISEFNYFKEVKLSDIYSDRYLKEQSKVE